MMCIVRNWSWMEWIAHETTAWMTPWTTFKMNHRTHAFFRFCYVQTNPCGCPRLWLSWCWNISCLNSIWFTISKLRFISLSCIHANCVITFWYANIIWNQDYFYSGRVILCFTGPFHVITPIILPCVLSNCSELTSPNVTKRSVKSRPITA